MTTYTVVWTPDDPLISSVTFTVDSLAEARADAHDLIESFSPAVSDAVITDATGNVYS